MKNKNGLLWCNIWLTTLNKGKCVIAIKLDDGTYQLLSNSSLMSKEDEWSKINDRPGWYTRLTDKDQLIFF